MVLQHGIYLFLLLLHAKLLLKRRMKIIMKKHALFILIPLIALTSCNQIHDKYNKNLPNRSFSIFYEFDINSKLAKMKCDFDYENVEIIDKNFRKIDKTKLIGGNKLVVYYDESLNNANYAEVSKIPFIEITKVNVPGEMTRTEFLADGWVIHSRNIKYVINADLSITPLKDVKWHSTLYGAYVDFEKGDDYNFCDLLYVFSFNPRK